MNDIAITNQKRENTEVIIQGGKLFIKRHTVLEMSDGKENHLDEANYVVEVDELTKKAQTAVETILNINPEK